LVVFSFLSVTVRSEDSSCSKLTGYYVGRFATESPTYGSFDAQVQISLAINTTDQWVYASLDRQNLTYSANEVLYLNVGAVQPILKNCSDSQTPCAAPYRNGSYAGVSLDATSRYGPYIVIYVRDIQQDKFVLRNTTDGCTNDPIQTLWWYDRYSPPSNVSWCLCCGDYRSGDGCPVNPWSAPPAGGLEIDPSRVGTADSASDKKHARQ